MHAVNVVQLLYIISWKARKIPIIDGSATSAPHGSLRTKKGLA